MFSLLNNQKNVCAALALLLGLTILTSATLAPNSGAQSAEEQTKATAAEMAVR